jgi:hypothetical protein
MTGVIYHPRFYQQLPTSQRHESIRETTFLYALGIRILHLIMLRVYLI